MTIRNFLVVLAIIILIAVASMWYTSRDNDRLAETQASVDARGVEGLEDANYLVENQDTVPAQIDSDLRFFEFDNTFEHTVPGEYSEVVVQISGFQPGEYTVMYLKKAGTQEYVGTGQSLNADENGIIATRFKVTEYGDYEVEFGGQVSPVITVN